MRAQIFFNTWENKAFIAKAIVKDERIIKALDHGIIAVARGTTNSFILKELLATTGNGEFEIDYNNFVAGVISEDVCAGDASVRSPEVIFRDGVPEKIELGVIVDEMGPDDILIKGGNALGPDFVAGILVAHPEGGTIGSIYAKAISRGITLMIPISLEKSIPFSMGEIVPNLGGQKNIDYSQGLPVGLFPVIGGDVFTELEAIDQIASVSAFPIGRGGIDKGAGGIVLEIAGVEEEVSKVINEAEAVINTKPLVISLKPCETCQNNQCFKKRNLKSD
ncbi:MAG: hypothetical protein ACTSP4_04825 [Candidatus Hodarchaeales archaeon]